MSRRSDTDRSGVGFGGPRAQLVLVCVVQILALSVWFSAAAVVPSISSEWGISTSEASWLTTAVQLGFVTGAVLSAVFNFADRFSLPHLIAGSAALAGMTTLLIPLVAGNLASAIPLRFVTGMALAGVYPAAIKLIASWFTANRAVAIGIVVGALTLGSGAPHLVNGIGSPPWKLVMAITSGLAFAGALASLGLRAGPHLKHGTRLQTNYIVEVFRDRSQRLINFGYLGHMWELYAWWTWMPAYLAASLTAANATASQSTVALASFALIGLAGAAGSVVAGIRARHTGSVPIARHALIVSGACCVGSGIVYGLSPFLLLPFLAIWGFAVIADSAQFSSALSEATDARFVGTALATQMASGFLLTVASIRLTPLVAGAVGWRWALAFLGLGPLVGAMAMEGLRRKGPAPVPGVLPTVGTSTSETDGH